MHKEHKAGEEVEVDWAGDTMSFMDTCTGELRYSQPSLVGMYVMSDTHFSLGLSALKF